MGPLPQRSIQEEFVERFECLCTKIPSRQESDGFTTVDVDDGVENTTETFRWLRNNSPRLNECTKIELLDAGLLDTCTWFCNHCFAHKPLSRSVLLQFLANFSMNNEIVQRKVFQGFNSMLKNLILSSDDLKLLNNSMMLMYNLCLHNDNDRLEVLKDNDIVQQIMTHWIQNEVEYSKIFLDSIFLNSKDFLFVYSNLPDSSKNQLMDLLSIWLEHFKDDLSIEVIVAVKNNCFIDYTVEQITSHVVNVLAKASCIEKFKAELQKDTKLLEKIMDLLIVIHERGKKSAGSNNEFSRVNDLSALFVDSELQSHKRYWFKSDVIRLIANMCYNNQEHQNLMRSKNIIPILLECCSFDAKNPLMREWSLFALRNILEGNLDNQNFVANIDTVGHIDPDSSIMLTDTLKMATINNSISNNDTMFI